MLETKVAITFIFREKIADAATDFHITNQAKLNSSEEKEGCDREDDLTPSFSHHISSTGIGLFLVTSLFFCTIVNQMSKHRMVSKEIFNMCLH